ncbi:MAG: DEAD/DEAH box helicase [Gammaproteobacteria bacterium]|nr:DEAD/DEAH box helicase [Gammaproteobacteria bacterium]
MLPSVVASELQDAIRRFLQATFPMTTPGFRRDDGSTMLDDLLADPRALFRGPYLSLGLPFRRMGEGDELPFEYLELSFTPYRHQQRAFQRLCGPSPHSTLVATGTGSGKTECFMLPILDYCAGQKGQGVKAIVIYPMNALATDQARRFAREIHNRQGLRGKVSVGLYVGDQERTPRKTMAPDDVITCKETLREYPPDILLTNYKMLDFLLMRPRDQRLWRFNEPGRLRYLVVDELHTFDGAQGTDLACLIRRLRDRLVPQADLACVGTSATLGGASAARELVHYAERVFAGPFGEDAVILEDRQTADEFLGEAPVEFTEWPTSGVNRAIRPELHDSAVDYLRAQALLWFGAAAPELDASEPTGATKARFDLGNRLKECAAFRELVSRANSIIDIGPLLAEWEARFRIGPTQARQMLESLLALVSWALRAKTPGVEPGGEDDGGPLVDVRAQLWLRELSRLVAVVGRRPTLHFADDLTELTSPLHLPAVHCRECHATGWVSVREPSEGRLESDLQTIYRAYFARHPDVSLLFPLDNDPPTGEIKGIDALACPQCGQIFSRRDADACPQCGAGEVVRVWEPNMRRTVSRGDQNQQRSHHDCPFCAAAEGLSLIGSRAASLSSVLIGKLFATPYNDHRKLIAFSDAVQDAAHRAGFFGARTYSTLVRSAIARFIHAQGEGMPLSMVAAETPRYWRNHVADDETFVGTFIAPNMEWLRGYERLREDGHLPTPSDLPQLVEERLTWEVLQGFGLRARIGRTLERSLTAAVGVDENTLRESARRLATRLGEEIGTLRGLGEEPTYRFLQGLLWRLRVQGAFYHPLLDGYIQARGKPYELYRTPQMPNYGGAARPPALVTLARLCDSFTALHHEGQSWYYGWFNKVMALDEAVLASAEYRQVMSLTVEHLTRDDYLVERHTTGESVWGLNPGQWICTTAVDDLACHRCGHRIQVPREDRAAWQDMPCLRAACAGAYQPAPAGRPERVIGAGPPHRLVPAEHTGLLDADLRHEVEQSFMRGTAAWDVNLLSATPTLEMGIDIGDLSSVLLCSVPPAQANYLQRIGRAGRRDGNALTVTVANAHKHDLYFFSDPLAMLAGEVRPPGVFLEATAVLERQLIAYCFDRWAATGIDDTAIPGQLRVVLDGLEATGGERFPQSLLQFIEGARADILRGFLALFPDLTEEAQEPLRAFLYGTKDKSGLAHRLTNRLYQLVDERHSLTKRIDRLKDQKKRLENQPQDEAVREELDGLEAERGALQALRRRMNAKPTLNFFTDEGLLPNYAFPEEGVTINSVILRRISQAERTGDDAGQRYERINFQMQRPAQAALSELAPLSRFYAVGREVEIDQVDLSVSQTQEWRLCDRCHYTENLAESGDPHSVCPRCGSPQWADAGRKRTLLRLRQVFATADDRTSRIGDDSDQRAPSFFNRQMLVDVPPGSATHAYRLAAEQLPFGFEYVPRMRLREINFGQPEGQAEEFAVAGEFSSRPGFQLCRHCGKVRRNARGRRPTFQHAYDCRLRRPGAQEKDEDYFDSLYLFRELESEAVRILLPLAEVGTSGKRLHSLIAALSLGLRRYFRGNVDHIQLAHHSEPTGGESRKHYLVLYDSVPGGTGYLKELLRRPENLMALLQGAYDVISRCGCREEEGRDGCYQCLLAYRESRRMDEISRQAAEEILAKILAEADTLQPIDGLGSVDINALLESELEQRLVNALGNAPGVTLSPELVNGKPGFFLTIGGPGTGFERAAAWKVEPQVNLGPAHGVATNVKPDFVLWPLRERPGLLPVAIFADGFQYHYAKLADDTLKRQGLLDSGRFRVWSLGWHNLPIAGMKQMNPAEHLLKTGQQSMMQELWSRLAAQGGWSHYMEYSSFIAEGPFRWLLAYLSASDDALDRLRHAALSRTIGWLDPRSRRDPEYRRAMLAELSTQLPGHVHEWLGRTSEDPSLLGGMLAAAGTLEGEIRAVCRLPYSAMEQAKQGVLEPLCGEVSVHVAIDDVHARQDKDFEGVWSGFWGCANLLQFLPALTLSSATGVTQGIYPIWTTPPKGEVAAAGQSEAADGNWREVADLSVFGEAILLLKAQGLPPPEVGVELLDGSGEVLPELELAWRDQRLAVVEELGSDAQKTYEQMGWTLFVGLDETVARELAGRLGE